MTDTAIERLHPGVVHHLVNTLGWRTLRPLQELAVEPLLAGDHVLLGAPTAGGKTEAAVLPLLSRMASEQWSGLTVLYVCPLRALLNNLHPRIEAYCELLGRKAALWHGDVGASARKAILRDPPDVLLTTPESIEAMFLSTRVDAGSLFAMVRSIVVDEIHAFAGDDRGWHLLALLQRLDEVSAHPVQRVGLSATVGNPDELLDWLATASDAPRTVVSVPASVTAPSLDVDWVASVPNAAKVIAALHHGEKRLVFADSRARVEELAAALRRDGVTTFVSHSSLSVDDRRQAERAFAEARDCVIVATSTLELGIDVGDLDRVIQLGAPRTVASVLQRIGRTGRRAGSGRNCLFLATSDAELLQAFALVSLIGDGWVEPLVPPARPVHLVGQQLLARVLSEARVGRSTWPGSLLAVTETGDLSAPALEAVMTHMVDRDILLDLDRVLQIGTEGERLFGRRHFMDVTSLFLTEPLLSVRWGGRLLGQVDPSALSARDGQRAVILLGGQAWGVGDVDWNRRVVWVEPTDDPGRSRWAGAGGALSIEVCHAIRRVLASDTVSDGATRRAARQLETLHATFFFARDGTTTLERDHERQRSRWWTFAGGRANAELAHRCGVAGLGVGGVDDLGLTLFGMPAADLVTTSAASPVAPPKVDPRRLNAIKFHEAVPEYALEEMIRARDADPVGVATAISEPLVLA
ncbi:MAG: ATP-dependent helicase Lhr and Lhr-like helicase [Solirubrobacteraceae bacterium]